MSNNRRQKAVYPVDEWLQEDNLILLECWTRDGYTKKDIATRIGISPKTLTQWEAREPKIREALRKGRQLTDYKVENALLKIALGYKTSETKITMEYDTLRKKLVETKSETTTKDVAPNATACMFWLTNRVSGKWKKNRDNVIELNEEDTGLQISVVRASSNQTINNTSDKTNAQLEPPEEPQWEDEINEEITIKKSDKTTQNQSKTLTEETLIKERAEDLDYWPEDWVDED